MTRYTDEEKDRMATLAVTHAKEIEKVFGTVPGSYKNYLWSALSQLRGKPPVQPLDFLVQDKLKGS
jgi:hypothetical protein